MKKQKFMGSKKFWMVLVAILSAFILLASILLLVLIPKPTTVDTNQQVSYVEQTTVSHDHSFEATKERVDSVNDNYGQQIKSTYSGRNSTMEQVMRQRMVFSTIKNILLYSVLILMIMLILVKGFGLKIFKKKKVEEEVKELEKKTPQPTNKPIEKASGKQDGKKKPISKPEKVEKPVEKVDKDAEKPSNPDEEEVASGCQLP